MLTIDDFVLLGTTVPEPMKDGRVVRCSAGFSAELGRLVRLYPLSPAGGLHRWDQYHVALERNPVDNRDESFKLAGDRHDQAAVDGLTHELVTDGHHGTLREAARLEQVDRFLAPSIKFLNERRLSLGIIKPEHLLGYRYEVDPHADRAQAQFEGLKTPPPSSGRHAYVARPRIQFRDRDGDHDLSFNGHDAFEWLRKNPEASRDSLFKNLGFGQPDRDVRLLVGNLAHQRNAWVVISYLSFIQGSPSLFSLLEASEC